MKLTPLDIQQKQFRRSWNGVDANEVEGFLKLCASEIEECVKETISLKEELRRKERKIAEFREREQTLQETMVTAQRMTADLKEQAKKEADIRLSEAELQAEKITAVAHGRLVQIVGEIDELKRQRALFQSQLASMIDSHKKLLETFSEPTVAPPRVDDNIAFLRGSAPQKKQGEGA